MVYFFTCFRFQGFCKGSSQLRYLLLLLGILAHSSRQHNYMDVIYLMHNSDIYAFKSVERNTSENMMCSKSEYNMLLYKGFSINISYMVTNSTK